MIVLFWTACALVAYAYVGYPALLYLLAAIRPRSMKRGGCDQSISVIIAARNEAENLSRKIPNLTDILARLQVPSEIIVVSDGSTDGTNQLLLEHESTLTPILLPESRGKAIALNNAVSVAKGEILVFFDARQMLDPNALVELCACFADPEIGAVSGELVLESADGEWSPNSWGLYWSIEKTVRRLESASGSVIGVTGAIYAIRRELYVNLPAKAILDDVMVPMNAARRGKRIIFQPTAIARDRVFAEPGKEFGRKVRTLTGNYQLMQLAPWLLTPRNPLLFRFISHKVLRLAVPLLLVLILISSALAHGRFFKVCLGIQLIFYGLAVLGKLSPSARRIRPVAVAETFTVLNLAAAKAFINFVSRRTEVWR